VQRDFAKRDCDEAYADGDDKQDDGGIKTHLLVLMLRP
jgi:hypothetical protein